MNTPIENAIVNELSLATGLAHSGTNARILFENQKNPALGGSDDALFISIVEIRDIAPATPLETVRDNPTTIDFEEILVGTHADVEFILRASYFARTMSGNDSAYDKLDNALRRLRLDGPSFRLRQAGVVFVEGSQVRSLPVVLETEYESRAVVDLRFRTRQQIEEGTTYIETVGITGTYT